MDKNTTKAKNFKVWCDEGDLKVNYFETELEAYQAATKHQEEHLTHNVTITKIQTED